MPRLRAIVEILYEPTDEGYVTTDIEQMAKIDAKQFATDPSIIAYLIDDYDKTISVDITVEAVPENWNP